MNNYLFEVLILKNTEFVPIEAKNIAEARKKFSEQMKSLPRSTEWCLIAVYRQI